MRPLLQVLATLLAATAVHPPAPAQQAPPASAAVTDFRIPAGSLADALDRFSEQSGLQIVYDPAVLEASAVSGIAGPMQADEALDRLLAGTGLSWSLVNGRTVAIRRRVAAPAPATSPAPAPRAELLPDGTVVLGDIEVVDDPMRMLPAEFSQTSFGFNKSLLETPRSVSFVSQETLDLFGLSAVEDLLRVVPGTYTPTRFGIQGGIDVRSVPADTFFRGMKRLNLQGHAPTVLSAMDSIEVVRGPPSPLYGMGKIGGYTNMTPRSGRAADGRYLERSQVRVEALAGSYDRVEFSADLQGPLSMAGRRGGYHLFGMSLDTDTYAKGVPIDAQLLQGAISLDEAVGGFRLETGASAQTSRSAGALLGRVTQDLIDNGRYIRGTPLADLDLNGDGSIGFREYHRASPARGALSSYNQPLRQRWKWPLDASGRPLPLEAFPKIPGIPESMYDYLQAHPEADPSGALRAQGIGGPLPESGYLPIGFVLDPRTLGYDTLDLRRFAAFERELRADLVTVYIDLIDDRDPDFTLKNQLFFDGMDQYKISEQPFGTDQKPRVWEDKFTITRRLRGLPPALQVNALASANLRYTRSPTAQCFGDFGNHRTDAMASTWVDARGGMTPNTTFTNCLVDSSYDSGYPFTDHGKTEYSEMGLGLLFDIDLWRDTNVLLGGRVDGSQARNVEYAGTVDFDTGTSAEPGARVTRDTRAEGWDDGLSWTLSVSQRLPWGLHPYFTIAEESLTLDNNANRITHAVIQAGHIGQSRLREAGLKASLFGDRLYLSTAVYQQRRIDVSDPEDPTITAEASSTVTEGWETEIKWLPLRGLFTSFYALSQKTLFEPNRGGNLLVDARTLGFQDVLDPATGEVIYPAEAFLFGGRAYIELPADMQAYRERQGNPNTQLGMSITAQLPSGLGFSFSGNYFSAVSAGRLQLIELPSATVLNAGMFFERGGWLLRADVFNLTDERYFRARNGDTLADLLVSAMPDRRWQFSVSRRFGDG